MSYIGMKEHSPRRRRRSAHAEAPHPVISNWRLEKLRRVSWGDFLAASLPMLFRVNDGEDQLEKAIELFAEALRRQSSPAIRF